MEALLNIHSTQGCAKRKIVRSPVQNFVVAHKKLGCQVASGTYINKILLLLFFITKDISK